MACSDGEGEEAESQEAPGREFGEAGGGDARAAGEGAPRPLKATLYQGANDPRIPTDMQLDELYEVTLQI